MTHILGLEHSLGGVLGQIGGVFGSIASASPWVPSSFVNVPGGSPGFTTGVDTGGAGVSTVSGDNCGTSGTELREVVINKATGAVICIRKKRSRKRRRRLATNSDIADLTSLKAVLGPKALDAWIATRGRR